MKAREATYLDARNAIVEWNFQTTNQDIYDFLEWIEQNIFDDEYLYSAWRRYNSVDFQGDCA
jgi:hypothetical protein